MLEVTIVIIDIVLVSILGAMAVKLFRVIRLSRPPRYTTTVRDDVDLPSVTVCIPARNEQHALTDCLERISKSTYQKLEIIVLDDVSGDDTSALIKSFASEGVRFVQGHALPKGWLGKNHALQGLLNEASGSYVLFVDVDTVLAPQAIENMIRYAVSHRASMLSVLPRREDGWRASVLGSPLRYFWELLFSRKFSPATSSNAWLIRREVLINRFDGFASLKNTVQPEARIATELAQTKEYKFLISTASFGVAFEKKWRSQLVTSVRLLYPLLGKSVLLSVLAVIDLFILLMPFILSGVAFVSQAWSLLLAINVAISLGFCAVYGAYAKRVWNKGWIAGAALWPYLLIQETMLVLASLRRYQNHTVTWKGRVIRPEAQN